MHPGGFESKTEFESVTAGCDHSDVNKAAVVKAKAKAAAFKREKEFICHVYAEYDIK